MTVERRWRGMEGAQGGAAGRHGSYCRQLLQAGRDQLPVPSSSVFAEPTKYHAQHIQCPSRSMSSVTLNIYAGRQAAPPAHQPP